MSRMSLVTKSLANKQVMLTCGVLIATSILALLLKHTEQFVDAVTATTVVSVLAPEYDFNARLKSLTSSVTDVGKQAEIKETLLTNLAKEHVPIITCALYDLVVGEKRLKKPTKIEANQWIVMLLSEIIEGMGLPADLYMYPLVQRYTWLEETKDDWKGVESKMEVNFVKDNLQKYLSKVGNFVPFSLVGYKTALNCKNYRLFDKKANMTFYGGSIPTSLPTPPAATAITPTAPTAPTTTVVPVSSPTTPVASPAKLPPPTFMTICSENKLQCFLMILLVIIIITCVVALIAVSISSISAQAEPRYASF